MPLASAVQRKHQNFEVLGLASRHSERKENRRYARLIRSGITTTWMGLRWLVPSMRPRAPCFDMKLKGKPNKSKRIPMIPRVTHTYIYIQYTVQNAHVYRTLDHACTPKHQNDGLACVVLSSIWSGVLRATSCVFARAFLLIRRIGLSPTPTNHSFTLYYDASKNR